MLSIKKRQTIAVLLALIVSGCANSGPISSPRGGEYSSGGVAVVAAGDIACDPATNGGTPQRCDQGGTAALIGQLHPTVVLPLGDEAYQTGTLAAFDSTFNASWGRYRSILRPSPGNHEYETPGAAGYFTYFQGIAPWYSFDLGSWHLISLNSECHFVGGCERGSRQEAWLKADLAAHVGQCTLVYWHEPRWSSGEHGDARQMTTIWDDLVAAHVTLVLAGHNHDYERFEPLDQNGQPDASGVTEFVVGTGGKNHYAFTQPALAGEVVRDDTSFGVLDLTLGSHGYDWRFVPAAGYSFGDAGSASCQ